MDKKENLTNVPRKQFEKLTEEDLLKLKIIELQNRLAIYERSEQPSKEEQTRQAKRVFNNFCANAGALGIADFQEMVSLVLGEDLSDEDAFKGLFKMKEFYLKQHLSVGFREFDYWWLNYRQAHTEGGGSKERDSSEISKPSNQSQEKSNDLKNIPPTDPIDSLLYRLHLKLHAGPFLESLLNMIRKSNQASQNNIFSEFSDFSSGFGKNVTLTDVQIKVGEPFQALSSVSFEHKIDPEESEKMRKKSKTKVQEAFILVINLLIRNGVELFTVGELCGSLRSILSVAQKEYKFKSFDLEAQTIENRKVLHIRIIHDDRDKLLHFVNTFDKLKIEMLRGDLFFSENPGMSRLTNKNDLRFLSKFSSQMDRSGLQQARRAFKHTLPFQHSRIFSLLTSMCQANMKLEFESLEDFIAYLNETNSMKGHGKIEGWASLRNFSLPFIKKSIIDNPDVPAPVKQTYFKSLELLEGVHSIHVQLADSILQVKAENLDLFNLLPNKKEIELYKEPEKILEGEIRVILLGKSGTGKTSFLKKLKDNQNYKEMFKNFNVETLAHCNRLFTLWDVKSEDKQVWERLLLEGSRILFFLDCTETDKLNESQEVLQNIIKCPQASKKPILVIGHKSDLIPEKEHKVIIEKICKGLDLNNILKGRKWTVKLVSSQTGSGTQETLNWLIDFGRKNVFSTNSQLLVAPYILQNIPLTFDQITQTK